MKKTVLKIIYDEKTNSMKTEVNGKVNGVSAQFINANIAHTLAATLGLFLRDSVRAEGLADEVEMLCAKVRRMALNGATGGENELQ